MVLGGSEKVVLGGSEIFVPTFYSIITWFKGGSEVKVVLRFSYPLIWLILLTEKVVLGGSPP